MDFFSWLPLMLLFYTIYTIFSSNKKPTPSKPPGRQPQQRQHLPQSPPKSPLPFPIFDIPPAQPTKAPTKASPSGEGSASSEGTSGSEGTWGVEGRPGTEGIFPRKPIPMASRTQEKQRPSENLEKTATAIPVITQDSLRQGVIWAEILGEPRSRRRWKNKKTS